MFVCVVWCMMMYRRNEHPASNNRLLGSPVFHIYQQGSPGGGVTPTRSVWGRLLHTFYERFIFDFIIHTLYYYSQFALCSVCFLPIILQLVDKFLQNTHNLEHKIYLSNFTVCRCLGVLCDKFTHTLHDTCPSSALMMSVLCFVLASSGTIDLMSQRL